MAGTAPDASVIVLGWNGRRYLDDCLSTVLAQDFAGKYEVLYVDNGSSDGSADYVRERYPGVRVIALDRNYGYAEGNNIGFRESRGAYAVFLNQDVAVHRSWLRELVAAMEDDPGVGAAHANVIQPWYPEFAGIGERLDPGVAYSAELTPLGYVSYRRLGSLDAPREVLFLHGVSIILRRDLGEQLGYVFDPEMFAYAEDMDLGFRVRALGYRCVIVPRAVVYHKHTLKTSPSWRTVRNTARIIRNRYLAYYKVMSLPEFGVMAALVTVGAPFNAGEFGLGPVRRVVYGLGLVPVTALALVQALASLLAYSGKRRQIRRSARRRGWWCLRATLCGVR